MGAAAWVIAVAIKPPASKLVSKVVTEHQHRKIFATLQGILSALTELGIVAVCYIILFPQLSLPDAIAFGVGASSMEIFSVLALGIIADIRCPDWASRAAWVLGARQSLWVRYMMFIERFAALLGHVGSRGLVYLGLVHFNLVLTSIAFILFSAVDGVTVYGRLAGWDWFEPWICRSFYLFVLMVNFLEIGIFTASTAIG
jgi:hypothetical protein